MNLDQARKIFERDVMALKADCVTIEAATQEFPRCFAFVYQSKKFVETGSFSEMLVGQGHVLISREDGRVFKTGSAFSVEHYVEAFEACGDPFGTPTATVKILAWNEGANKVEATKLVKAKSALGLSQAKAVVDNALSYKKSVFTTETVQDAKEAVLKLKEYGFVSIQLWRKK